MDLRGRVAVVTGGASGIGRAMCLAFADHGAEAVVVADIDADGARGVAAEVQAGGAASTAFAGDMSAEHEVVRLVEETEAAHGRVDVFCANAGIIVTGGVEVADEAWARIWAINVQSHIYAARALVPRMLARGEGYLVHTASAAGLLTQLGSAPYSVTKHAVVGLAEWLSVTYGDRGLRVSCLCPQAVETNLAATSARAAGARVATGIGSRPPDRGPLTSAGVDGVLTPEQVAAVVVEAIADERFLILPHPEVATYERRRAEDRDRWLRGMRRLQARLDAAARSR